jgi:hypothetical protein
MDTYILPIRVSTSYKGTPIDLSVDVQAGAVFRLFDATSGQVRIRKEHALFYGMFAVYTGMKRQGSQLEFDYGLGFRYEDDNHTDFSGSGIGGYATLMHMHEVGFMQVDHNENYVVKRPDHTPESHRFWGNKCRHFRLAPEYGRLNFYAITTFKRYDPRSETEEVRFAEQEVQITSLLCLYAEQQTTLSASVSTVATHTEFLGLLLVALQVGRRIMPNSFVHLAMHSLDAQRDQGNEEWREQYGNHADVEYIANTVSGSSVYRNAHNGVCDDKCTPAQHAFGVFPGMCAHKLINVYSNIHYKQLGNTAISRDKDIEYQLCVNDGLNEYSMYKSDDSEVDGQWYNKRDFGKKLESLWVPILLSACPDFITKYVRDEGTAHGYWSVVGTRVHRKCYLQALVCVDYRYREDFLEIVENAEIQQVVAIQNECMKKSVNNAVVNKLEFNVTVDMYERVFCNIRKQAGCPDAILLEDFTANMMGVARCAIEHDGYSDIKVLSPEYPVYWPFGMFSKTKERVGRAYETRVDLLLSAKHIASGKCRVLLVEYKTRMEISQNGKKVFELSDPKDRLQLRLNTWMLYLNTSIIPFASYIVQASRRVAAAADDQAGAAPEEPVSPDQHRVRGCVAKIKLARPSAPMVRLITRFAIHPYGDRSVSRYCDKQFMIPSMTKLLEALGYACDGHSFWEDLDKEDGTHPIFTHILRGSCFNKKVMHLLEPEHADEAPLLCLPDGCVNHKQGDGIGGYVEEKLLQGAGTQQARWTDFSNRWRAYDHSKDYKSSSSSYAVLQYDDLVGAGSYANFVPVLFDINDDPLLYCNTKGDLQIVECEQWHNTNAHRHSNSVAPAINQARIFRKNLPQPTLKYRINVEPDIDSEDPNIRRIAKECAAYRSKLKDRVQLIANRINKRLSKEIPNENDGVNALGPQAFWEATTEVAQTCPHAHLIVVCITGDLSATFRRPQRATNPRVCSRIDRTIWPLAKWPYRRLGGIRCT